MPLESIFSLVQTVIILIIVILLANFTLKYLNKHMSGNNKIVKIIERVAVNKNSYISVVEISGKYYLMSFNENSNEILKELDKKEIEKLLAEFEDEGRVNYLDIQKKVNEKLHNFRSNHNRSNDANSTDGFAQEISPISEIFDTEDPERTVDYIKLLGMMTVLTLAPSILILTTSFTRIIVVLSFLRNALGTQQSPPNQLLIGLALFLTFFIMQPVYTQVMETSVEPYLADEISQEEAFEQASIPIKEFMLKETREKDLALFLRASGNENVAGPMDLSLTVIIPAFAISELRLAFSMGFIIYIPFLVIDMVVASILMSMGMFMLPPVMISLPFKILLFVLVDGWYLVVESLLNSFA